MSAQSIDNGVDLVKDMHVTAFPNVWQGRSQRPVPNCPLALRISVFVPVRRESWPSTGEEATGNPNLGERTDPRKAVAPAYNALQPQPVYRAAEKGTPSP